MTAPDIAGIVGVALILAAYVGAQLQRLDPLRAPSLLMNLAGALLILLSLAYDFNLPAVLMETAWALTAVFGLVQLARGKRPQAG